MSLVRNTLVQASLTLVSRVLGLLREAIIAAKIGAGPVGDAFFAALMPLIVFLVDAAKPNSVALEINAHHARLDLRDTHARLALDAGVKLAIDTDAHGLADFHQLRYGILPARRAGATKRDVVNCLTRKQLAKWLKRD